MFTVRTRFAILCDSCIRREPPIFHGSLILYNTLFATHYRTRDVRFAGKLANNGDNEIIFSKKLLILIIGLKPET